jgi:predicted lipoprotein with Yx(FWY)xxD motif
VSVARARAFAGVVAAFAVVALAACSSGGGKSTRPKPTPTTGSAAGSGLGTTVVFVRTSPYGDVLTSGYSATLYMNVKDSADHSACTGRCATTWLPLVTDGQPQALEGASGNLVSAFRRGDGRRQVTYNGHPLYTYRRDHQPLEASGQGTSNSWYLISATGDPVTERRQ